MISARRGPIPCTASRSGSVIFASFAASLRTARVGTVPSVTAQAAASAAAVPEVPIARATFPGWILRCARLSSRPISCPIRASSAGGAGSAARNSSVSRTAPSGKLTVSLMRLRSESVISQLPPPRSTSNTRPATPGSPLINPGPTTPRWISRPSSRPEMISIFQPVSAFTHAWKAGALRASRIAEVATTRIRSTPCNCTAR